MKTTAVIIPAAGIGKRMQSDIPKTFLELENQPVLYHTLMRFTAFDFVTQIIIATGKELISEVETIIATLPAGKINFSVVEGGKERQDSINNALAHVGDVELISVHDAVRPFFSSRAFLESVKLTDNADGAILAIPTKDTIKVVGEGGIIRETPARSSLWQAQTPQTFRKSVLLKAYASAVEKNNTGTDDSTLVEMIGGKVLVTEGNPENIKLTFPSDMLLAKQILNNYGA